MIDKHVYYSASTSGFYTRDVHGENIPEDVVEITEEQWLALLEGQSNGKVIAAGDDGMPVLADPPPSGPPMVVSMRQARLALLEAGLLGQIGATIGALPSPQKEAAQIEWEYATEIRRDSPTMILLGGALGLNEKQLGDLFIAAAAK